MTYKNISEVLEAVHGPINGYEARRIVNSMLYGYSSSDKNMTGERINPDYVQQLVDEFLVNVRTIDGTLRAEVDSNGTGLVILKGETPILYKGRFLKDQFSNEAMISLLHARPATGAERIFESRVVTRKYIIGENGLYENNDLYTSFIDSVRQLEDPNLESIDLKYYYHPNSDSNISVYIDRKIGYRRVEEKIGANKSRVQESCFDPKALSVQRLHALAENGLARDRRGLYSQIYQLEPVAPTTIRIDGSTTDFPPKVYRKY